MTTYVAKTNIKHGVGNDVLEFQPGDELPTGDEFTEDQIAQLLEADAIEEKEVKSKATKAEAAAAKAETPAKVESGPATPTKTPPAKS